jgi:hypothetical protein
VSRLFLVPKPGNNKWRVIYDLRPLNKYYLRSRLRIETLLEVKHLTRKGDFLSSFDLQDGFYALGTSPPDRDNFNVNVRGQLYRLGCPPIG